jgi:hypothetical protein
MLVLMVCGVVSSLCFKTVCRWVSADCSFTSYMRYLHRWLPEYGEIVIWCLFASLRLLNVWGLPVKLQVATSRLALPGGYADRGLNMREGGDRYGGNARDLAMLWNETVPLMILSLK